MLINIGNHVRADAYGRAMKPDRVRAILGPLYALTGDVYKAVRFLGYADINKASIYAPINLDGLRRSLDQMYED